MRTLTRTLFALSLAVVLGAAARAEEKKAEKKPAKKGEPYANVFSFPKQIKLTDEQQEKLTALKKEYLPKLEEIDKKLNTVMTPERRKTAAEARKKAQGEGKKGKEVAQAVSEALKLTPEEESVFKEANAARAKLVKEIKAKATELLTPEQKEQLKAKPKAKPAAK